MIELVLVRPCLYDKYSKYFADSRGLKPNAWADIAKAMNDAGFTKLRDKETGVYYVYTVTIYFSQN